MSITKEQILDAISEMSIMNIMELISMIENKFGVSAQSLLHKNEKSDETSDKKEEKTEFDVILKEIGSNKISVIKSVRSILNLGLKEAKDLVESAPILLKEKINKNDAKKIKEEIEKSGASISIQ